jgi:putative inorganic carbon (HCO3(-)) transporter
MHRIKRLFNAITTIEWLLYSLMLPVVLFPTRFNLPLRVLVLLLIPALWCVRRVASGHFVPATPLDWAILGLLLMVLVSLFVTPDLHFSLPKVIRLVYGIAVFYAAVAFARLSHRRLRWGVVLILALGLGVALLGLVGARRTPKLPFLTELSSSLPQRLLVLPGAEIGIHPNEVAGTLLWVAPLAVAIATAILIRAFTGGSHTGDKIPIRLLFLSAITALLLVAALILSQSRAAMLGLTVALMFMALVATLPRRWLVGGALLVALLLALILILSASGEPVTMNLLGSGLDFLGSSPEIGSLNGRMEFWSRAIYGIQDFAFTGMGMNTFRLVVPLLYPMFTVAPDTDIAHAHNQLLQTGLDFGIPGLVAYLALWLGAAGLLWGTWRVPGHYWLRVLALGLAGSLLAYFVYGLLDTVALGARPGFIFWLLLGLVASLHWISVTKMDPPSPSFGSL